jgi:hypothetical protein
MRHKQGAIMEKKFNLLLGGLAFVALLVGKFVVSYTWHKISADERLKEGMRLSILLLGGAVLVAGAVLLCCTAVWRLLKSYSPNLFRKHSS